MRLRSISSNRPSKRGLAFGAIAGDTFCVAGAVRRRRCPICGRDIPSSWRIILSRRWGRWCAEAHPANAASAKRDRYGEKYAKSDGCRLGHGGTGSLRDARGREECTGKRSINQKKIIRVNPAVVIEVAIPIAAVVLYVTRVDLRIIISVDIAIEIH